MSLLFATTNPEDKRAILFLKKKEKLEKAKALEATIEYALTEGQTLSGQLGYIPLPPSVVQKVAAEADKISPDYQINVQ